MTNFIYKTLAQETIEEIYREHGITPENQKILNEILEEIATETGVKNEEIQKQMEKIKDNPQKDEMLRAFVTIGFRVAQISGKKPKPT